MTTSEQLRCSERLDRVEEFLYFGDGTSLQAWMGQMTVKMDVVTDAVKCVPSLKEAVELHLAEPHLWKFVKSKWFLPVLGGIVIAMIVGFIVLHLIATYIPNMWDWIMRLLGIPTLQIPII